MRIRSVLSHSAQAVAEGALISLVVVGLVAGTAFAAKSGKPSGGSSVAVVLSADANGDGAMNWADKVTFTFSTSNPYPVISLSCSQGGVVVYGDSRPMYWPNAWDDHGIFTLSSIAWDGGAADCKATLKGTSHGKVVALGSATFHVAA